MIQSYKILIVEDEFINAKFIENVLFELGHTVVGIAAIGEDALNLAKQNCIDLVFIDINLAGAMDGITCAKLLNETKKIPIIYTTAYSDSQTIEEAGETFIFGFLVKPFDDKDIEATLQVALKRIECSKKLNNNKEKQHTNDKSLQNLGHNYTYDKNNKVLTHAGEIVELTKKELNVLDLFCKNSNQYLNYDFFRENIWNEKNISDSTIRDTILRLRKKVLVLNILNSKGLGYILKTNI